MTKASGTEQDSDRNFRYLTKKGVFKLSQNVTDCLFRPCTARLNKCLTGGRPRIMMHAHVVNDVGWLFAAVAVVGTGYTLFAVLWLAVSCGRRKRPPAQRAMSPS